MFKRALVKRAQVYSIAAQNALTWSFILRKIFSIAKGIYSPWVIGKH